MKYFPPFPRLIYRMKVRAQTLHYDTIKTGHTCQDSFPTCAPHTHTKEVKFVEQLINAAINGNDDSFVLLMEQNMQSMYKAAWVYLKNEDDIADAIQDTILACYEKLNTLKNPQYFKTWMIRILLNKCSDILKKRHPYIEIADIKDNGAPDHALERSEWQNLLGTLDEKYSIVFLMYYYEQMPVKEIGKALQISQNTVLTRLRRGRQKLRQALQPQSSAPSACQN